MKITSANDDDVEEVMALIKDCIRNMESQGIYQWSEHYPTREIFQDDIARRTLYTIRKNERIIGIMTLNEDQPREYASLTWSRKEGKILVVHRLAVNPRWQRRGIAGRLLDFAEEYAVSQQYRSIRLDTYSGNPRALRLYEARQYKRVGQVHFPGRQLPFYCYEKILK